MTALRKSPFALRVVQRKTGKAAIVYRRTADATRRDRLQRIASLSPLAFTAATPMLREAVAHSQIRNLPPGKFLPLDADWGARVASFALIASGLRDGERLLRAVGHLRHADGNEAAWWLGMLTQNGNIRALRALRILTEAVE